ncbi:fibronectin type III domain-containing protein [Leptospira sp. 'Mane']|uniref:fibronectin type III domain-containing protein n=1 Tax=Leptospira sp. 'Mane' TaxID=3387407 RepID=UPI00398B6795
MYHCGPLAPQDWSPSMAMVLGLGGSTTNSSGSKTLTPGQTVTFNGGQGNVTGTVVDTDGDGVADAIVIDSSGGNAGGTTSPSLILIDSDGDGVPNGVDANGDGVIDYYITVGNNGSITLTTEPNGGNQVTILPGQGFDSNGDGIVDNPILGQLANDTTLPTSLATPAGGTYPSAKTVTILCSDNIAPGNIVYTVDGTAPGFNPVNGTIKNPPSTSFTVGSEGNGTYSVRYLCRDMAGNLSTSHTDTYVIDSNVPNVTASLASLYVSNNGGAINSSLLTWSSNVSGNYSVRSGGTDCTDGSELSNGSITAAISNTATTFTAGSLSLGNTTIRICVTNPNNGFTGSYALTITRDDTPPTVTASPTSGSYVTLISISLACNDTGGAGCDKIAYASGVGSAPTNPAITGTSGNITSGSLYSSAIAATDQATTYIKYLARDQAGNTSTVGSENYIVDTTVPTPTQVSALGVGTEVFVQWAPVSNATEYRIYYDTSSSVTTSSTNITGISSLYHKITGLTVNTMYYVRVEARNGVGGISSLSQEQRVFTASTPPGTSGSGSYADISAGQGFGSGQAPSATIDPISNKLLVATSNGANNYKSSLFRCDLDGSNCVHTDISAGQGASSGVYPTILIDSILAKLLVVTSNGANNNRPSLFRCDLDGQNCAHFDLAAGQGVDSGQGPTAIIDPISNKLLVVAMNATNNNRPSLFRCNLDGSNCIHTDISAGQGAYSGAVSTINIDFISNKLVVVTSNGANDSKPSLFRCNLDGSNCTHTDISAGQGMSSGSVPNVSIDYISSKILVVTINGANSNRPSLFRCNLDGSNCTHTDISAGQGAGSDCASIIDPISSKLLVVTRNTANNDKSSLFRCDLDGSNCLHTDISIGQGTGSGLAPFIKIDPISGKLLVLTENGANNNTLSLFRW